MHENTCINQSIQIGIYIYIYILYIIRLILSNPQARRIPSRHMFIYTCIVYLAQEVFQIRVSVTDKEFVSVAAIPLLVPQSKCVNQVLNALHTRR